jgi:DNA repair protein RadC
MPLQSAAIAMASSAVNRNTMGSRCSVYGQSGRDRDGLSQRLLADHGGLRGPSRLEVAELVRVKGLGDAKAVRLKAALELGWCLAALPPEDRPPVGSPEDVANLLSIEMAALEQEQLRVVLLDTKHRILGTRTVYQGSLNQRRLSTGHLANTAYNRCSY